MPFVQLIEFRTDRIDEFAALCTESPTFRNLDVEREEEM
jgi:hypothetical protein